jgi:hypothetical protein
MLLFDIFNFSLFFLAIFLFLIASHLYVLAVECRALVCRDVDTGSLVYVPLELELKQDGMEEVRASETSI